MSNNDKMEIERKFLISDVETMKTYLGNPMNIRQFYLVNTPERVERIRVVTLSSVGSQPRAYHTIKGRKNENGAGFEDEREINAHEAVLQMMDHQAEGGGIIYKQRYLYSYDGVIWEIDYFPLFDLWLAEVELEYEGQEVSIPDFIGMEVTKDPAYFNSNMISKDEILKRTVRTIK